MLEIPPLLWSTPSRLIVTFELPRVGFEGVNLVPHRLDIGLLIRVYKEEALLTLQAGFVRMS
jgi:hypothetical protein